MGDPSGDAEGGFSSDSRNKKNTDNHTTTTTVDYWTRAIVQNMREDALLVRKIGEIEKEHSQIIIQMTYTHRQLTDRLKLVNWYQEKKKERERERDVHTSDSSSSGSSRTSLEFRDFKSELREYREWKERMELRRGKKNNKPTLEPELLDRMKLEMNVLRRPQPPILPPLIKPSYMYRQWKRKMLIDKSDPKLLLERKKMYLIAEDAEEQQRQTSNGNSKRPGCSIATKNYERDVHIKRQQATAKSLDFNNNENVKGTLPTLAENDSSDSESGLTVNGKPRIASAPGSRSRRFSGHKSAIMFKTGGKRNQSQVPRSASSAELQTVTVIPLHPTKDRHQNLHTMRATTSFA